MTMMSMTMRKVHASSRGGGITTATITNNYHYDDDDDGWVHGGKYVPPPASSVPRASSPASKPHNRTTAASTSTTGKDATKASSPYSTTLSPVSLCTPVPMEELYDLSSSSRQRQQQPRQNQQQRGERATRTPLTIQLQRLLRPTTPRDARPTTASTTTTMTIPASSYASTPQQLGQQQHPPPPSPIESFLRQSGLTPHLSHTLGNFLYQFLLLLLPIVDFLYESILLVWNTTLVAILPILVCDIIESICEMTWDFLHVIWRILRFALPYVVWIIQTTIALILAVGGTILWLLAIIIRGRKRAIESGLDSIQSSAIKSLKESVRNSPFGKNGDRRRRLPFSGFTNRHRVPTPQRDELHDMLASSIAASSTTSTREADNGKGAVAAPPRSSSSSLKSTPTTTIASAMRSSTTRSSNLKRTTTTTTTPHHRNSNDQSVSRNTTSSAPATANNVRTPSTATTRRVLFFETEAGEVVTDVTTYDKHMPASARKDRDYSLSRENYPEDEYGGDLRREGMTRDYGGGGVVVHGAAVGTSALDDRQSREGSSGRASSNSTLPSPTPKKPTREASAQPKPTSISDIGSSSTHSSSSTAGQLSQHPSKSKINGGSGTDAGDRKEQQYTITPLSKRYARMKLHQQQQQRQKEQQRGQLPLISDTAATASAATNNNPKRKRRGDLIGAASRLGRQRRARLMTTTTVGTHSLTFLDRNRTPKRRRDDDDLMARTDDLIWRALNNDEKENNRVVQEGGSVAKRGKFNGTTVDDCITSTPSKTPIDSASSSTPVSQTMTPPKSPEPSKFNWASSVMATPGLKKVNGRGEDSGEDKTSATAGSVATPFKHSLPLTFDEDEDADTEGNASISSVAQAFSFGPSALATEGTPEAKISFGKTSGIASVTKPTESQQSLSASPSAELFGQSTAPSVKGPTEDVAPTFAFTASSVGVTSAVTTPASFSFGSTSQPAKSATPAPAAFSQPPATTLTFGNSGMTSEDAVTTKAATALTTTPALFGISSQPASSAPTSATASHASSSMFGFGNATIPSDLTVATSSTGAVSFGTGAMPTSSAAGAAFAFGTPSQSASTPTAPSSTFSFGATNVAGGSIAPSASGLSAHPTSTFAFGAPSQTASFAAAPFSFAATNPTTGGAAIPTPIFGAASTDTFRLGGGVSSSGGGASARRRAAKASGRRI